MKREIRGVEYAYVLNRRGERLISNSVAYMTCSDLACESRWMADAESPDDHTEQLMAIRLQLETFEHAISKAVRGSYEPYHPKEIAKRLSESDPVLKWRLIEDFFETYQSAERYSIVNLPALAYSVMDLKLQYYFVTKVGPGTWNALLGGTGLSLKDDPPGRPGLYLQHLYLMQAEIGQVRFLGQVNESRLPA